MCINGPCFSFVIVNNLLGNAFTDFHFSIWKLLQWKYGNNTSFQFPDKVVRTIAYRAEWGKRYIVLLPPKTFESKKRMQIFLKFYPNWGAFC